MSEIKEYGGFIPFDIIKDRTDYFAEYDNIMVRVNTGRTAILYALNQLKPKRAWVPYYNCPLLKKAIEDMGIIVNYYRLSQTFLPLIDEYEDRDALIWVNYFGLMAKSVQCEILNTYRNIVFDNTQAFFAKPIMREDVYNAYSCRKFFGVPDGGYVIGQNLQKCKMRPGFSWNRMTHLFKSVELGTNEAYNLYEENEEIISRENTSMSQITSKLMCQFDFEKIASIRKRNYAILSQELNNVNDLSIITESDMVPFIYPFLNRTEGLREYLISKRIYVPTWWKSIIKMEDENDENKTNEWTYASYLMPIPIDQRYDGEDMIYLANIIKGKCKDE